MCKQLTSQRSSQGNARPRTEHFRQLVLAPWFRVF